MDESLINKLCEDLKPIKKIKHPLGCALFLETLLIAIIGVFIWYLGMRPDLSERMMDPVFLFEMSLIGLTGITAALCSFWLRVPDMRGAEWMLPVPLTLLAVFVLWTAIRLITGHTPVPSLEFHHCMGEGILMVAVPAALMFFAVLGGCTIHPVLMAVMNGTIIASAAYMALRLTCGSEDVGHILFTHLFPFIIIGGGAGFLARRFYKW